MTPIIDLNYKKPETAKVSDESDWMKLLSFLGMFAFSVFLAVVFLTNICGGKFW